MDEYEQARRDIENRARLYLAEPVSRLLAVAYEPRVEDEAGVTEYDKFVATQQDALRGKMRGLTQAKGGTIEAIALEIAQQLQAESQRLQLQHTTQLLESAIARCRGENSVEAEEKELLQPERVIGRSGKPIGLWR